MLNYKELNNFLDQKERNIYGPVTRLPKNEKYLKLINHYIAGNIGEYTSLNQYIYESIIFEKEKEFKEILLKISQQEIKHIEILNQIVINLGGNCELVDSKGINWNTKYISYENNNLKDIIKYNIELEKKSIISYYNLIKYTNNINLRMIYEKIMQDERTHKYIFETILSEI